jgi:hypothetical protein
MSSVILIRGSVLLDLIFAIGFQIRFQLIFNGLDVFKFFLQFLLNF